MVLSLFVLVSPSIAAVKVSVIVLPFTINAKEDLKYLRDKIPAVIRDQLQPEGAKVKMLEGFSGPYDVKTLRRLGTEQGADQVVWGSLTWINDRFSLDAKTLKTFAALPPESFFTEGKGIETLLDKVAKLARNMAIKLFDRQKVAEVRVTGNKRIEADAIKRKISTAAGEVFLAQKISKDLKTIYNMGYFDDIRIEAEPGADGQIVTFIVKEKPTIRHIRVKGNLVYDDDKILENTTLKRGAILNIFRLRSDVQRIEALYKEKNYHNVKVEHKLRDVENNQTDVEYKIKEGGRVKVKTIKFVGNNAYSAKKLKKVIETDEKGFLSIFTASGELDPQELEYDRNRLAAFYLINGYTDVKIAEPQLKFEGKWIYITIKIEEGIQYKVGTVDLAGDLMQPAAELKKKLKIISEAVFNRKTASEDVLTLSDLYADFGYANAKVVPLTKKNRKKGIVDITYDIAKGSQVYFERITIRGNKKTRDKVIRREFKIKEQDLYNRQLLKKGVRNLHRLEFFENVKVDTVKGSADDKVVLDVEVTERPTGSLSFGGGYSEQDGGFVMAEISQRNLFGRGQKLTLKGQVGQSNNEFTLGFTEPWLFDIPLSAGFDLYKRKTDYDQYERDSYGAAVRFSYPLFEYVRGYLSYIFDDSNVIDIEAGAANSIQELAGHNLTSKIISKIRYDSRNRMFNPSEGSEHSFTAQYAGLGGDVTFTKFSVESAKYFPLFWGTVFFIHGQVGYVTHNSGGILPDYERFYLGGMNSVRGFPYRGIHAADANGDIIGGDKLAQFNVEYIFPLSKAQQVVGLVFFDAGNVFGDGETIDILTFRQSVGGGIRWFSPVGPIRIEYGHIIDAKGNTEKGGRWELAFGAAF